MRNRFSNQRATLMAMAMTGAVCLNPIYSSHAAGVSSGVGGGATAGTGVGVNTGVGVDVGAQPNVNTNADVVGSTRIIGNKVVTDNRARLDANGDGVIDSRDSGTTTTTGGQTRMGITARPGLRSGTAAGANHRLRNDIDSPMRNDGANATTGATVDMVPSTTTVTGASRTTTSGGVTTTAPVLRR
jgi:hypothetical protein